MSYKYNIFTGNFDIAGGSSSDPLKVPYTGASGSVNLGAFNLTATNVIETTPTLLKLNQTSAQTFINLAGGTGLMKVTAGLLGLDTSTYLTGTKADSISNSDGTLTISPTTGTVVASLALSHDNTWTGKQTFNTTAPNFGTMTLGSVLFAGTSGILSQDNSNLFWDATNHRLGLGTTSPTRILGLGNSQAQEIGIEDSSNIVVGRSLSVKAGNTVNTGIASFTALNQTSRPWRDMASTPSGNVYACHNGGDIYMQTAGTGNFVALNQTNRGWYGMVGNASGNVYACVVGGDIYMQTNGTGNFIALGQTSRDWIHMAAASNGNVYACVLGGDIYMQTNGTGDFVALNQTTRNWFGMTANGNDVYACLWQGGGIYKQTNGTGDFVTLNQTGRDWRAMAAADGNVYACVSGGDVYMQTAGAGDFVALGDTPRNWSGMCSSGSNIYADVDNGDIYMRSPTTGTANLDGGALILKSGIGKGTGTSVISFFTATPTTSGTNIQTSSEKVTILGSGNVGIGTTAPTAKLHLAAGTATANTAPLKLTSGTLNTTAEAGAVEFLTDAYYGTITTGAARKTFAFLESPVFTTPTLGVAKVTDLTVGGTTGVNISASAGVLTFAGVGNTNNENLILNFEGTANQITWSTGTGASKMYYNGISFTQALSNTTTTSIDGFVTSAVSASTAGTPVRMSPRLRFSAHSWNTGGAGSDKTDSFIIENLPTSGAATSPNLVISSTADGGAAYTELIRVLGGGNMGIGVTAPTAALHLKACTASANTASLKIDAGTLATAAVSGNIESDGTHLYWTDSGGTRRQLDN